MSNKLMQYLLTSVFTLGFTASLCAAIWVNDGRTALITLTVAMAGALVLAAILPNLSEFDFGPQGVKATLQKIEAQVDIAKSKLETQQSIINDLVIYSLSQLPYNILWKTTNTPQYTYHNSDDMRRWFYVLLDNGLIQPKTEGGWLIFDEKLEGANMADLVKPTPAGEFLLSLRGPPPA